MHRRASARGLILRCLPAIGRGCGPRRFGMPFKSRLMVRGHVFPTWTNQYLLCYPGRTLTIRQSFYFTMVIFTYTGPSPAIPRRATYLDLHLHGVTGTAATSGHRHITPISSMRCHPMTQIRAEAESVVLCICLFSRSPLFGQFTYRVYLFCAL